MFKDFVFLTKTDTTIGFISQNEEKLTQIKQRPPYKHYIKAITSLKVLKSFTRVPKIHKNRIRRSKKTTFIMPNANSYRIIDDKHHLLLLKRLSWTYTTSANLSAAMYDEDFAKKYSDVIITPLESKKTASAIYKLEKNTIKRIR
ncbi:MAG: Sua5 YciO YrdC YwlC family protein [Campylobacterota bacterium]|nr:Sua5 YciO YrdC YwlC family protein [Campylobacterota bacterium]